MSQTLLSVNLVEAFSWDCLRDKPDPVGDYLASVLRNAPPIGLRSAKKAGELWADENPIQNVFLCVNCGARSVSIDRGMCMGCGSEGNEDFAAMIEEFASVMKVLAELKGREL